MTSSQYLIIALLAVLLLIFATDRYRIEVIALAGLAAGVLLGLVAPVRIFSGLSNPAVVTVVEILLIVQALHQSHLFAQRPSWLKGRVSRPETLVFPICAAAAGLSAIMNNVGAFSLMVPVALSVTRLTGLDQKAIFMPLSFATLLGGLCTPIGTPPNLIVSQVLADHAGSGFGFADFLPAGLAATLAGLIVLAVRVPRTLPAKTDDEDAVAVDRQVLSEVRARKLLSAEPTVAELAKRVDGRVHNLVRSGRRLFPLKPEIFIQVGDVLSVEADQMALERIIHSGEFDYARKGGLTGERVRMDAVVMPQSLFVGSRIATIASLEDRDVQVVAIASHSTRFEGPLDEVPLRIGDILVLEGKADTLRSIIAETGLIEVAGAATDGGRTRWSTIPVFAAGIVLASFGIMPPQIAFGLVVLMLSFVGALDLRAGLHNLNWPIVLLLFAMLPLGEAVGTTGAAAQIASALAGLFPGAPPILPAALMLALAMLITPFVNNATTAVILAPIAVEMARMENVSLPALLMAIAIGASCDFLTPFGHHNNTLAYSLGGYRFSDFFRFGWPLSLTVYIVGCIALACFWIS